MSASPAMEAAKGAASPARLMSIDALRGFDMFWIVVGALVASGAGLCFFALFHYLIDVRGWTRWAFLFRLFGLNAIAIYFSAAFLSYKSVAGFFFGGVASLCGDAGATVLALGTLAVEALLLYFLYRNKIFFKV